MARNAGRRADVLLYAPLMVATRLAWRYRTTAQVDRALDIVKGREVAHPFLRRVK